jgi:hypothetical protein
VTRAGSRVAPATPEAARTRRSQARAFLDVAELVLDEPATRSETHVAAALAVLARSPRPTPSADFGWATTAVAKTTGMPSTSSPRSISRTARGVSPLAWCR